MPRVKRGMIHLKSRKKLRKKVKGYKGTRKNTIKAAKTAVNKAGAHSYADRKKKKRVNRSLWQIKISAFVKEQDISYSKFIGALKKSGIIVDRKILADIAVNNKEIMTKIIEQVKENLPK
jgi:large subunit ribosomal protein L20